MNCIPVKGEYTTSLEKWQIIRDFAVKNYLPVDNIDDMINRIKTLGDVRLGETISLTIEDFDAYFEAMYHDYIHPCPHCSEYECEDCPLRGVDDSPLRGADDRGCCAEWSMAKNEARRIRDGVTP